MHVNDCVGHQMAALYQACLITSSASNINDLLLRGDVTVIGQLVGFEQLL